MNPINAIAKGTTTTASQIAGGMTQQIRSNLPSVSRAVYGLGLGMGPLIQNIVSEFKEDKEKKKKQGAQEPSSEKNKLAEKSIVQGFSILSNQMKSVVSLLQDIKMINTSQLNAAQRASYEKQRSAFQSEEDRMEGLQKPGVAATPTDSSGIKKDKGFLSNLFGMFTSMPFWLQLLGGALVGKSLWDMLDESTKQVIRQAAGELTDVLVQSVFKSVGDWLLNNKALAAGIAMLIAPTLTARAAMGIARWLFPKGGAVTKGGVAAAGVAATGAAATMAGMTGLEKPSPSTTPTTRAGTPPIDEVGMKRTPGGILVPANTELKPETPPATDQKPKPTLKDNFKKGVGKLGTGIGKGFGILGIGTGVYGAADEFSKGNYASAGLYGTSALLSTLAMIPGPWSPFLAMGAFGTSMAAGALSPDTPAQGAPPQTTGPTPAGTGNDNPFEGLRLGTAAQAAERTSGGPTALGVVDLARKIQNSVSGIKEITAFNDRYHQDKTNYASKHKEGLAMDFTIKDPKQSQLVAAEVRKILMDELKLQPHQFQVRDEYKYPSSKSTAGHIHVQLNSAETANQLAQALGRSTQQLAQSSMASPETGGVKPSAVTPTTVATADAESAGPLSELIREAMDFSRMVLTGDVGGERGTNVTNINTSSAGGGGQLSMPVMSAEAADVALLGRHAAVGS